MTFDLLIEGCTLIRRAFEPPVEDAAIGVKNGRFAFAGPRTALPPDVAATRRIVLRNHLVVPGS